MPPRQPQPTPAAAAPEPAESEPVAPAEEPQEEKHQPETRRKRDWGSIFQKTFDKINKSFSAAEDEEI